MSKLEDKFHALLADLNNEFPNSGFILIAVTPTAQPGVADLTLLGNLEREAMQSVFDSLDPEFLGEGTGLKQIRLM